MSFLTLQKLAGRKSPSKPISPPKLPSIIFPPKGKNIVSSPKTAEGTPNSFRRVIEVNDKFFKKNGRSHSPMSELAQIKNKKSAEKISEELDVLRRNWEEMGGKKDFKAINFLIGSCFTILDQICGMFIQNFLLFKLILFYFLIEKFSSIKMTKKISR